MKPEDDEEDDVSYHEFKTDVCKHCGKYESDEQHAVAAPLTGVHHAFEASSYGSFEVFYHNAETSDFVLNPEESAADQRPAPVGWYWWPCHPGCLPDGDPCGPFETEEAAFADAQEDGS